MVETAVD